jgi:hypothetical protein
MLHDTFYNVDYVKVVREVEALVSQLHSPSHLSSREDFSEYVAHLQLHMALQARNLVPTLTKTDDSREQLLHQTQANFEKFVSRQAV